MRNKYLLLVFALSIVTTCTYAQVIKTGNRYPIIPYPAVVEPAAGSFSINSKTTLVIAPGAGIFINERAALDRMLKSYLGIHVLEKKKSATANTIVLKYDASVNGAEAYRVAVDHNRIVLSAKHPAGMFYAVETLRQLLPADVETGKGAALIVPAVKIADQPAFTWRGMMLDVSRHFFSIAYLQKYVDMMAMYKLNKLHLHLTDDQGWRIEIKKYPLLTQQSAWREYNGNDSACMKMAAQTGNTDYKIDEQHIRQVDGKTLYGGFYTQEQMRAFIKYAAKRHVEVIPEIDMPGHMIAAVKVYPYLTCDSTVGDLRGFSNPICPCKQNVLDFAKDIFSEIAALFPSKYIHIGGDEVDMRNWEKSPLCQAFMREKGFTKTAQLQSYFNDYMLNFFHSKGKTLIGWDEVIEGGIDSTATVMFWRPWAKDAPHNGTKNGNKMVMSPDGPLYFDAIPDAHAISDVYNYNPLDAKYGMNKTEESRIIGVQANLWSEMIPSEKRADYMIMPRMTALAELGWTHQNLYDSYLERLTAQYARLDKLNINYRMPDLEGLVENNVFVGTTSFFKASPLPYFSIHYTTDGSMPLINSPVLTKPLEIDRTITLKLALFTPAGRRGDLYTLHFNSSKFLQAAAVTDLRNGLTCGYYKGSYDSTTKIKEKPDSILMVPAVVVPAAITAPEFGLKYKGYIDVPENGIYSFYLNCNDGGVLRIADEQVIDNDGLHSDKEKGGQIALQKGLHPFAVDFTEGGGGYKLELKYSIGGSAPQVVPEAWFKSGK